jgi:hypothetical protein
MKSRHWNFTELVILTSIGHLCGAGRQSSAPAAGKRRPMGDLKGLTQTANKE